ncbi:hypothetical protein, partial [uncultured Oscillibacter sp.]
LYWSFPLPLSVCLAFTGFNQCFLKEHVQVKKKLGFCRRCAEKDKIHSTISTMALAQVRPSFRRSYATLHTKAKQ